IALWVLWGPVRETVAVVGSESTSTAYYEPVERFVAGQGDGPVRIEMPLTRSHWEAALLAPSVSLARGWEKQLDSRYDQVLLTALGHDAFALRAAAPGNFVVRVHHTRYWTVLRGDACVASAPGAWTSVSVASPGTVVIAARFSLSRALGLETSCRPVRALAL